MLSEHLCNPHICHQETPKLLKQAKNLRDRILGGLDLGLSLSWATFKRKIQNF